MWVCASVGAINEEMVKQYIENQDEEEGEFKVWDLETEKDSKDLEPDNYPVK